jgi:hypothetical protein
MIFPENCKPPTKAVTSESTDTSWCQSLTDMTSGVFRTLENKNRCKRMSVVEEELKKIKVDKSGELETQMNWEETAELTHRSE